MEKLFGLEKRNLIKYGSFFIAIFIAISGSVDARTKPNDIPRPYLRRNSHDDTINDRNQIVAPRPSPLSSQKAKLDTLQSTSSRERRLGPIADAIDETLTRVFCDNWEIEWYSNCRKQAEQEKNKKNKDKNKNKNKDKDKDKNMDKNKDKNMDKNKDKNKDKESTPNAPSPPKNPNQVIDDPSCVPAGDRCRLGTRCCGGNSCDLATRTCRFSPTPAPAPKSIQPTRICTNEGNQCVLGVACCDDLSCDLSTRTCVRGDLAQANENFLPLLPPALETLQFEGLGTTQNGECTPINQRCRALSPCCTGLSCDVSSFTCQIESSLLTPLPSLVPGNVANSNPSLSLPSTPVSAPLLPGGENSIIQTSSAFDGLIGNVNNLTGTDLSNVDIGNTANDILNTLGSQSGSCVEENLPCRAFSRCCDGLTCNISSRTCQAQMQSQPQTTPFNSPPSPAVSGNVVDTPTQTVVSISPQPIAKPTVEMAKPTQISLPTIDNSDIGSPGNELDSNSSPNIGDLAQENIDQAQNIVGNLLGNSTQNGEIIQGNIDQAQNLVGNLIGDTTENGDIVQENLAQAQNIVGDFLGGDTTTCIVPGNFCRALSPCCEGSSCNFSTRRCEKDIVPSLPSDIPPPTPSSIASTPVVTISTNTPQTNQQSTSSFQPSITTSITGPGDSTFVTEVLSEIENPLNSNNSMSLGEGLNSAFADVANNSSETVANVGNAVQNMLNGNAGETITNVDNAVGNLFGQNVTESFPNDVENAIGSFVGENVTNSVPDVQNVIGNIIGDSNSGSLSEVENVIGNVLGGGGSGGSCVANGLQCRLRSPCCDGLVCNIATRRCEELNQSSPPSLAPSNFPTFSPSQGQQFCILEGLRCRRWIPCCNGLSCDQSTNTCDIDLSTENMLFSTGAPNSIPVFKSTQSPTYSPTSKPSKTTGTPTYNLLYSSVQSEFPSSQNYISYSVTNLQESIPNAIENAINNATGGIPEVQNIVDNALVNVTGTISDVQNVVDNTIGNPSDAMSEVQNIVDNGMVNASDAITDVQNIVDNVMENPTDTISDVQNMVGNFLGDTNCVSEGVRCRLRSPCCNNLVCNVQTMVCEAEGITSSNPSDEPTPSTPGLSQNLSQATQDMLFDDVEDVIQNVSNAVTDVENIVVSVMTNRTVGNVSDIISDVQDSINNGMIDTNNTMPDVQDIVDNAMTNVTTNIANVQDLVGSTLTNSSSNIPDLQGIVDNAIVNTTDTFADVQNITNNVMVNATETFADVQNIVDNAIENPADTISDAQNMLGNFLGDTNCVSTGARCRLRSPCCNGLVCNVQSMTCEVEETVTELNSSSNVLETPLDSGEPLDAQIISSNQPSTISLSALATSSPSKNKDFSSSLPSSVPNFSPSTSSSLSPSHMKSISPSYMSDYTSSSPSTTPAVVILQTSRPSSNIIEPGNLTSVQEPIPDSINNAFSNTTDAISEVQSLVGNFLGDQSCVSSGVRCKIRSPCCTGLVCSTQTMTCEIEETNIETNSSSNTFNSLSYVPTPSRMISHAPSSTSITSSPSSRSSKPSEKIDNPTSLPTCGPTKLDETVLALGKTAEIKNVLEENNELEPINNNDNDVLFNSSTVIGASGDDNLTESLIIIEDTIESVVENAIDNVTESVDSHENADNIAEQSIPNLDVIVGNIFDNSTESITEAGNLIGALVGDNSCVSAGNQCKLRSPCCTGSFCNVYTRKCEQT